ncbi:ferrous iron transport protein A [Paraneptunicella aestuarii]|uniref:FeoA family protein n=1 Tax=Paraneptunicella aestuarii TaxID=2831148 RepID=UPI001E2871E9|nr:FeoA family protein [Paraneptunicella aestuarii]UAA38955.1 ferrous iron transport protein A [Paraneptunicella aestuarii]
MTVWDLPKKTSAYVSHISDHLEMVVVSRLQEMGFNIDCEVLCLRRSPFSGPIVIQLGDSVISLEKDIADKIYLHHS